MSLISGGGSSSNGNPELTKELTKVLQESLDGNMTIMPHEFLYLICNSESRLQQIKDNHKADFRKEIEIIH
jgi:hypothetical protein